MQMQRQNYYTDFIPTGAAMLAKTIAETNSSNKKPLLAMAVMHRSRSPPELNAWVAGLQFNLNFSKHCR